MHTATVDDWPILCQHRLCLGTATPATWLYDDGTMFTRYLCQEHMQRAYNQGFTNPEYWVQLTPNQRPSQVQEVHSGSQDQGTN